MVIYKQVKETKEFLKMAMIMYQNGTTRKVTAKELQIELRFNKTLVTSYIYI